MTPGPKPLAVGDLCKGPAGHLIEGSSQLVTYRHGGGRESHGCRACHGDRSRTYQREKAVAKKLGLTRAEHLDEQAKEQMLAEAMVKWAKRVTTSSSTNVSWRRS